MPAQQMIIHSPGCSRADKTSLAGPDKKLKLMLNYPASVGRNMDEILRVVEALQLSAKHSVATPANWPYKCSTYLSFMGIDRIENGCTTACFPAVFLPDACLSSTIIHGQSWPVAFFC